MADIISVANTAELYAALSSAQGGERIELAGGDYGSLSFRGMTFPSDVTITSADPADPAAMGPVSTAGFTRGTFTVSTWASGPVRCSGTPSGSSWPR